MFDRLVEVLTCRNDSFSPDLVLLLLFPERKEMQVWTKKPAFVFIQNQMVNG